MMGLYLRGFVCLSLVLQLSAAETISDLRAKRGVVSIGNQVLKRLLTGAIRLNGDQPKTWYAKRGGRTAVARDFMSIKRPLYSELMTDEGVKRGKLVGDRFIEVNYDIKPPRITLHQVRYLPGKDTPILKNPVIIEYLDGRSSKGLFSNRSN